MAKSFNDIWTGTPPTGTERIQFARNPGDAEYLAAVAGLPEQTISRGTFTPGTRVRCPKAFGNGEQTGVVYGTEQDRHVGLLYLVDTPEGRLRLLPDELEVI